MMKIASIEGFVPVTDPVRIENAKTGIIMDTETTGIDTTKDEVTELAMLKFTYDSQGIIALGDLYDEFNEPSIPIPEEVTRITGITDEMVKGHKIDPEEVRSFLSDVNIVLAHNASFDRKIVERQFKGAGFEEMEWHCTVEQIDWAARGKNGRSLEVLAVSENLTYGSHRADADIIATAYVLRSENEKGVSAFAEMLENGNTPSLMIIARGTPFNIPKLSPLYDRAKPKTPSGDFLKQRGYRWSPDGADIYDAADKAWHTSIFGDEATMSEEADFLRNIYGGDVALPCFRIEAKTRYSERRPGETELFRTAEVKSLEEAAFQSELERQPALDI
jgi:DNA polymerase-3 subunit epsilon